MRAVLIAVLAAATTPAFAQQLPRFNVETSCKQMSELAGQSQFMYGACFDQEQRSYDGLKPIWSGLPKAIRSNCVGMAELAGGTYFMLKACVDQELAAMRANTGREFKF